MWFGRSVAWGLVGLGAAGCGPELVPSTEDTGSSGGGTTVSVTGVGGSSSGAHDGSTTTTSPADGTTGSSTTGDEVEGSTTDPFACGCPDDTPVELDTQLGAGFTPAEALAVFQGLELPLRWVAYEGMSETVVHVDAAYVGGFVGEGPGGEDGCAFLSAPCNDGVAMDVELTFVTDDGALDITVPARITGNIGGILYADSDHLGIRANAGTLASWPLLDAGGRPFVVVELDMDLLSSGDEWQGSVVGWSAEPDAILLGEVS